MSISEFPNDDAAAKLIMADVTCGNVTTETLKALAEEGNCKIVSGRNDSIR